MPCRRAAPSPAPASPAAEAPVHVGSAARDQRSQVTNPKPVSPPSRRARPAASPGRRGGRSDGSAARDAGAARLPPPGGSRGGPARRGERAPLRPWRRGGHVRSEAAGPADAVPLRRARSARAVPREGLGDRRGSRPGDQAARAHAHDVEAEHLQVVVRGLDEQRCPRRGAPPGSAPGRTACVRAA